MPRSIFLALFLAGLCAALPCGWPVVYSNGRVAHAQTAMVQRMLNAVLPANLTVDGDFGPQTTAAVQQFETAAGLKPNGIMDLLSWPPLVAKAGDVVYGASGDLVLAVQAALTSNGFSTALSGTFDAATAASLSSFQSDRGAANTGGHTVDTQTWHLLASGCNSSSATSAWWVDAGWPQGNMTVDMLRCLSDGGVRYAVFECWREYTGFWEPCVDNVANAWAAGMEAVGVYMFPERAVDPATQVASMLATLHSQSVRFDNVMLDIEGSDWDNYTQTENQVFITGLRSALEAAGQHVVVYCGPNWNDYFGTSFTTFHDLPVVYAHYDNVPSYYDFVNNPYGGWTAPAGKQFWDGAGGEVVCGTGALDWDWSAKPFW